MSHRNSKGSRSRIAELAKDDDFRPWLGNDTDRSSSNAKGSR
jgi:hypothetical protein